VKDYGEMNETPRDRDEADVADEAHEAHEPHDDVAADPSVPEADALEQSEDATRRSADDDLSNVGDRPEGDALEQARGAGSDDDDERR
jgi:hypothetical protein